MFARAPTPPSTPPKVGDDVCLIWRGETYRRRIWQVPEVVEAAETVLARVVDVVDSGVVITPLARPKIETAGFGPWSRLCVPLSCVHEVR